jgi:biopolymer transport protein ExbD
MRRVLLVLTILVLGLTACSATGDTTVDLPAQATQVQTVEEETINSVLTDWKNVANEQMKADAVKPETLQEVTYTMPGTLADVQTHYNALTNKGWYTVKKMTNTSNDQILLLGYEHGTTALVVGAIDATRFGGNGVVVYTLKGTK